MRKHELNTGAILPTFGSPHPSCEQRVVVIVIVVVFPKKQLSVSGTRLLLPDPGALRCLNWARGDSKPRAPWSELSASQAQLQRVWADCSTARGALWVENKGSIQKTVFPGEQAVMQTWSWTSEMEEQSRCQAQRCSTLRPGGPRGMVRGPGHEGHFSPPSQALNRLGAEAENSLASCSR